MKDLPERPGQRVSSPGGLPAAAAGLAVLAALLLALAGCGDLPLFPGELAVSPDTLTVEEGTSVTVSRAGGYDPLDWSLDPPSASGGGSFDPGTLHYTAPTLSGSTLDVVLTATDYAGESDSLEITVYPAFAIDPTDAVVPAGGHFDFAVSGGMPPYQYSVALGSGTISPSGSTTDTTPTYTAASGVDDQVVIQAADSLGNVVEAMVSVVNTPDLLLSPTTVSVVADQVVQFVVYGGWPSFTYYVESSLRTVAPTGPTTQTTYDYTAPGTGLVGQETVRVVDGLGAEQSAIVTIVAVPLTLSPSTMTTGFGEQSVFTADGGMTPYAWSVDGGGSITPLDGTRALYTAPGAVTTDWVKVTDASGKFRKAKVYVE